jgi:CHAD domain-containing protein
VDKDLIRASSLRLRAGATPARFTLTADHDPAKLNDELAASFKLRRRRDSEREAVYFDTFDWRLYFKGLRLSASEQRGATLLRLESADGQLRGRASVSTAPAFAADLPPGQLRDEIAGLIRMRRLLPLVGVHTQGETLSVLDKQGKTVVRVHLEQSEAFDPERREPRRPLSPSLHIVPVRGYKAERRRLTEFIVTGSGLPEADGDALTELLAAIGRHPGDYTSRLIVGLDPDAPADVALRRILRALLDKMKANEDGLRRDLDTEFLHDFRVAVRRTRSILGQFKDVLPGGPRHHFAVEFRWLGGLSGPVRDLDVHLMALSDERVNLPPERYPALDVLRDQLCHDHDAERKNFIAALDSKRYARLLSKWKTFLDKDSGKNRQPAAATPIVRIASQRIWKRYRRAEKDGREVAPHGEPEALHQLRIDCKKLRYLLEFFRGMFDADAADPLIKSLKQLQDILGEHQDLQVQQDRLRKTARELGKSRPAGWVDALLLTGGLIERYSQRQATVRQRFSAGFSQFAHTRNRARLRRLVEAAGGNP